MQVKLNRGPGHGKRMDTEEWKIRVQVNKPIMWPSKADPFDQLQSPVREGEYHKSYRHLKDGTVIFEWMGWTDGKP